MSETLHATLPVVERIIWPDEEEACRILYDQERWEGTVADNLVMLRRIIEEQIPDSEIIWGPSRLMSTVMDAELHGLDRILLASSLTNFTLNLLHGTMTERDLNRISEDFAHYGLLDMPSSQWVDPRTLSSTNLPNARHAAMRMHKSFGDDDIVMLSLGHGGFAASMLIAKEFEDMTGRILSAYPLRFSRRKFGDSRPQMLAYEEEFLSLLAGDKILMVVEEDAASGETLRRAVRYFAGILPVRACMGLVCDDHRRETTKDRQGEWWEKVGQ